MHNKFLLSTSRAWASACCRPSSWGTTALITQANVGSDTTGVQTTVLASDGEQD